MARKQRKRQVQRKKTDSSERMFRIAMIGVGFGMLVGALIAPETDEQSGPLTSLVNVLDAMDGVTAPVADS